MKFREKEISIFVPLAAGAGVIVDSRTGLVAGTIKSICGQFGTRCKRSGGNLKISGPADRVQRCLEKIHYGGIPYFIAKPIES